MRTWEKYLYKELFIVIFFFLLCFFSLYVLIDYATHSRSFNHGSQGWDLFQYYCGEFVLRIKILLPFAIVLATIKTLLKINRSRELVALLSAGISLKRVLIPFLVVGLLGTSFLYFVEQSLLPEAMKTLQAGQTLKLSKKKRDGAIQKLLLKDGTLLLYQNYLVEQKELHDVIWVESPTSLWRMESLKLEPLIGENVDHLIQNEDHLQLSSRFITKELFQIPLNSLELKETLNDHDSDSIVNLFKQAKQILTDQSERSATLITALIYKCLSPWMALFATLIPIPWCVRYSRQISQLLIYAGCLFAIETLFILLDAGAVLGERQTVNPFYAMGFPFALTALYLTYKLVRTR
jgi:lipopolysaccharide export system permease protein